MKELEFIEIIKNTLADSSLIGDDTAFLQKESLAITQDTLVEDVHFRLETTTPYELGYKAIAVNLSDLAAAGATPCYALISLSFPANTSADWVKGFYEGVGFICDQNQVIVAGGDITGGDKLSITVTALGKTQKPIKRSFAKVGDIVFVTGEHGNSRAGLEILEKNLPPQEKFVRAHKMPTPRTKEGITIAKTCQKPAVMDTSDGLADALFKIAEASKVTLEVDFAQIPQDESLKEIFPKNWQNQILFGGEDYELLACVRPEDFEILKKQIKIHPIGRVIEQADTPAIIKSEGKTLKIDKKTIEDMAFDHFGKSMTDLTEETTERGDNK